MSHFTAYYIQFTVLCLCLYVSFDLYRKFQISLPFTFCAVQEVLPVMSRQHELWLVTGECRVYVTCSRLQLLFALICIAAGVTYYNPAFTFIFKC